jgi:hypothetical protein
MKYLASADLATELDALADLAREMNGNAVVIRASMTSTEISDQLAKVLSPMPYARTRTAMTVRIEKLRGRRSTPQIRL